MAEAAVAAARPAAGGASDQLGRAFGPGRIPRPAGRLAGLPRDGVRHAADGSRGRGRIWRRVRRQRQQRWRRLLGRRRLVRRRRRQRPMVGAMAADEPVDLSPQDRQRISAAIQAAERRTTGEIVCVLARHSAESTALPILLAALAALALPWLLVGLTTLPVLIILSLQLALFLGLAAMLSVPRVRVGLLPKATRQAIAHRAAMEQFMLRGIGRTEGRTGVLVFVSLAERYARIVADEAIAARVAQAEWQSAIDALVDHMRRGRIADGFVEAIERCGVVLATHFPAKADERSELPDGIYLI